MDRDGQHGYRRSTSGGAGDGGRRQLRFGAESPVWNQSRGRRLEKPVAHYTLSWAEGETPDRQEKIAAVLSSLKVLGLDDRQAVIVAHNDGRTPHVHVVANRVSPEDGRAAKLSRWAESYEREQGHIHCPRRVENNRRRSQGCRHESRETG